MFNSIEEKPTIVRNQTKFEGRPLEEVQYLNYWPCIVYKISDDKERLIINYGKYLWDVPSTSVYRHKM